MTPPLVMFDMDGTLLESKAGIIHTLRLTLSECGMPLSEDENLDWCIGASLWAIFEKYLDTTDEHIVEHAVNVYRHIYRDGPMFEYDVYDGVPEALAELKSHDTRVVIATAKAHEYAREIILTTPFADSIDHVYGSELDGTRVKKTDLLGHVLELEKISADQTVMIGDRHHDIDGAVANNVRSIGVEYGYGSAEELAAATHRVATARDLVPTIKSMFAA